MQQLLGRQAPAGVACSLSARPSQRARSHARSPPATVAQTLHPAARAPERPSANDATVAGAGPMGVASQALVFCALLDVR